MQFGSVGSVLMTNIMTTRKWSRLVEWQRYQQGERSNEYTYHTIVLSSYFLAMGL